MKNIGLYFGTFNPIHVGHLIIANHLVENSDLDEIWMVITPHNPFKKKSSLLDNHSRYDMVEIATKKYEKILPSDLEFRLPQPNYTSYTLAHITDKHPNLKFSLIMGEDNLKSFHKWKNYEVILEHHNIYVYPRVSKGKIETQFDNHPNITIVNAPIIEISSTMIRNHIKEGKNTKPLLDDSVFEHINKMNFYRN